MAAGIEISPVSRARVRPRGSRRETLSWYLMRLTGVALFVLALAHFSILHFVFDPAEQTADFIANERWNRLFWRAFDWLLLSTVLFHSFVGLRTVVIDYVRGAVSRTVVLYLLYALAAVLFVLGTHVVLTLPVPGSR
jgi:succinate dehydrogenase / fumarate reductase membrane anchor subunit